MIADFDAGAVAFEGLITNVAVTLIATAAARPSVIGVLVHFPCNTAVSGLLGTLPLSAGQIKDQPHPPR